MGRMTLPPLPSESTDDTRPRRDLLAYRAEWRQQARAVADAYRRWSDADSSDQRAGRFSAYVATLDQEHAAATSYAGARDDVERWLRHRGR
jgi:hypothetical protein